MSHIICTEGEYSLLDQKINTLVNTFIALISATNYLKRHLIVKINEINIDTSVKIKAIFLLFTLICAGEFNLLYVAVTRAKVVPLYG